MIIFALTNFADMVKLVDMPDLGSGAARRVGSSPIIRTKSVSEKKRFFCGNRREVYPDFLAGSPIINSVKTQNATF